MSKRILITAGGTGGHLYPAQALAEQLLESLFDAKILFAGKGLSSNKYFDRSKYLFQEIPSGRPGLRGGLEILCGIYASFRLIRKYNPHLIVGFGSYHTFPLLLAAAIKRKPFILHEANSIPGKVNRMFASYSQAVGVNFLSTRLSKGNVVPVGMPLRRGFRSDRPSREAAAHYFGLSAHFRTILVMGGSQGAQAINEGMMAALPHLKTTPLQIIHFAGNQANLAVLKQCYDRYQIKHYVHSFESRPEYAWALADLAITRAGGSSLAEQLSFSVPGIVIPYPHATDDHQKANALAAQDQMSGIQVIFQDALQGKFLAHKIDELLAYSPTKITSKKLQTDFCTLVCQHLEKITV